MPSCFDVKVGTVPAATEKQGSEFGGERGKVASQVPAGACQTARRYLKVNKVYFYVVRIIRLMWHLKNRLGD